MKARLIGGKRPAHPAAPAGIPGSVDDAFSEIDFGIKNYFATFVTHGGDSMSDFEKILQDAKFLSEAIGGSDSNASNNLFSNMAQITNMMDIIKSFRSAGAISEMPPPSAPALPAVAPVSNKVGALLAIAPYMGDSNRKNIIVASKLMELMHIVNNFDETEDIRTISGETVDNKSMLLAARPYIEPDKRDMVDLLITVMDISEILGKIERMNVDANQF